MASSNPYLAHLDKGKGSYSNGSSSGGGGGALDGMVPRKVNGAQTLKAMVCAVDCASLTGACARRR